MKKTTKARSDIISTPRMPRDYIKNPDFIKKTSYLKTLIKKLQNRSSIQKDDHFSLVVAIVVLIALIIIGFTINETQNIRTEVKTLSGQVEAIETRIPELNATESREIPISMPRYDSLPLPNASDGSFKSWENWEKITNQNSKQYHLQQLAYTDNLGFRRFNGYYLISLGQFYSNKIGQRFQIQFGEGRIIDVMIGDVKADKDCVDRMYCKGDGSIVEFIVDVGVMDKTVLAGGNLSILNMQGRVLSIEEETP